MARKYTCYGLELRTLFAVAFVIICTARTVNCVTVDYSEIVAINKTCPPRDTCITGKGPRLSDRVDWDDRNCFCDDLCAMYGDCCVNAKVLESNVPKVSEKFYCRQLRQFGGVYMKGICPDGTPDSFIKESCERQVSIAEDPFAGLPVTSLSSYITYSNYYCAACHDDSVRTAFWKPRVECPSLDSYNNKYQNLTAAVVMKNLVFRDPDEWGIYVTIDGVSTFHHCFIDPVFPEIVEHHIRNCRDAIDTCSTNWTDGDVADKCSSYTAYVYHYADAYKNPHCAVCNDKPVDDLFCIRHYFPRFNINTDFSPLSFAVLLDLSDSGGSSTVGETQVCDEGELWDPFFKKCRNVVCGLTGYVLRAGKCVALDKTDNLSSGLSGNDTSSNLNDEFISCPKYVLDEDEYKLWDNGTVFVPVYARVFNSSQFEVRETKLIICAISEPVAKFDVYMTYVSIAGLGASLVCLVLHLLAVLYVTDLQNLSGKNLASLCIALIIAYIAFIVAQFAKAGTSGCVAVAIVMFFGFLASFFWMNVMAFDVWRTLKRATSELRLSTGKQWKKFIAYSVYGWVMPAGIVASAIVVESVDWNGVSPEYRPGFGANVCWFSQRKALLVFFAAPLAAIMAVNIIFFISSARMIVQTTKSSASLTCGPTHDNLKLYARLALIMGLTWISGLVAAYLNVAPLWYIFVALNTLQGVFIFLAFTCTKKVRDRLSSRRASTTGTWGWAVDSTRKSHLESRDSGDSRASHSSESHLTKQKGTGSDGSC